MHLRLDFDNDSHMYICLCHPFSDKKVQEHLENQDGTARVADVYEACSGGEKPNCCSCMETLKDIVKTHNSAAAA
ncbi:MAG: hypothetical protein DHS20C02_09510 [Micavibrio sp.]|nr:MAG: hypothetical protein DHS20C02_09510 [Micavibrio sp.]